MVFTCRLIDKPLTGRRRGPKRVWLALSCSADSPILGILSKADVSRSTGNHACSYDTMSVLIVQIDDIKINDQMVLSDHLGSDHHISDWPFRLHIYCGDISAVQEQVATVLVSLSSS